MNSLCILHINPLLGVICKYFLLFGGFFLLIISFAVQKLFSLMKSYLLIFAFIVSLCCQMKTIIVKTHIKEQGSGRTQM